MPENDFEPELAQVAKIDALGCHVFRDRHHRDRKADARRDRSPVFARREALRRHLRTSKPTCVLLQHLIRWVISSGQVESRVDAVLQSVLDTEITPELVPTGEEEELQSSAAKVGPFALQDFSSRFVH